MYFVITRDDMSDFPDVQGEFSSLDEAEEFASELQSTAMFDDVDVLEPIPNPRFTAKNHSRC